jgi:hypothetical protein
MVDGLMRSSKKKKRKTRIFNHDATDRRARESGSSTSIIAHAKKDEKTKEASRMMTSVSSLDPSIASAARIIARARMLRLLIVGWLK